MASRFRWVDLAALLCVAAAGSSHAGTAATAAGASGAGRANDMRAVETGKSEEGTRWADLSAAHKAVLKPLELEWPSLTATGKRKWVDIASRLPRMSQEERNRIEARMAQWAATPPAQRARTRQQFKEAEQAAPKGRSAQWDAYQALSDEQKHQLARRAARSNAGLAASAASGVTAARGAERPQRAAVDAAQQKSNIVPNPALAARPRAVSPVVVQAAPGATTTLLSKRASPPPHQQAGMPKINGSPAFVDPATLLPQRGPQGAAVTAASASTPLPRP